jgi:glycosyltransferase involved in cell wall biosynthesis
MSMGDPSTTRDRATQVGRSTLPVAVVMTAHSGAPFLKAALDSIREQTAPAAEVIVVDDISGTVTTEGVQAAGARLLRHPLGLNAARNAAILETAQPWIAFMDTDDEWVRHKLEAQWGAIETCPDVGAVFSNCWEFDEDGVTRRPLFERLPHYWAIDRREVAPGVKYCEHESLVRQFLIGNFIWRATMLVRRDLLLRVGLFDPALAHLEDRDCWLRLLTLTRMAVIEEPLMWSRSNLTHRAADSPWEYETALDAVRLSERILSHPAQYPPGTSERYAADQGRCYLNAGRFTEERGDLEQARRYYIRGWQLGGGLRPLGLAILSYFPAPVRRRLKSTLSRLKTARRHPSPI